MNCKKCGNEIDKKAVICPNCGCKVKKPIHKEWWFWVVIVILIIAGGAAAGGKNETNNSSADVASSSQTDSKAETKSYEKIELQIMIDDLKANALKAENTYNNKYVEITGRITNFDSDGSYISIESVSAGDFNLDTILCNIGNKEQLDLLLENSTGDIVTIRGKVTSVGEILGYSVKIEEILQ